MKRRPGSRRRWPWNECELPPIRQDSLLGGFDGLADHSLGSWLIVVLGEGWDRSESQTKSKKASNMNAPLHVIRPGLCVFISAAIVACVYGADKPETAGAVAELKPTQASNVRGTVTFTPTTYGVRVAADVTGLSPGDHGFHIHEKGDCSAPDGSSAGGHFNPAGMPHGGPRDEKRHVGDLGNLVADDSGKAHYEVVDRFLTLEGTNSIIGRSVIVHEKVDDLKSQPTGNAGGRVACGVIQRAR